MKIKELSLRQARRICSVNKGWCEDCPLNRECLVAYVTDKSATAKKIGESKVGDRIVETLKKEGIYW